MNSLPTPDKILIDILTGQYREGQRLFVASQTFNELLKNKIFIERDKVFKPTMNTLTLNGVSIHRAPSKILTQIEKSR